MKKIILLLFLLLFLLCSCHAESPDSLQVEILKIGKADAIILQTPSHAILIDTGEKDDSAEVCEKLSDLGISALDLLIVTHYDKDHIGGAPEILGQFPVKEIVEAGYEKEGKVYSAYRKAAQEIPSTIPTDSLRYEFDDLSLTIEPPRREYDNENDASLVVMAVCQNRRLLFTGDILEERIDDLLDDSIDLTADFLKVPHHGKLEQNSGELFAAVSPACAAITCSDKNPPDEELVALLAEKNCAVYETRNGDLRITVSAEGILSVSQ